MSGTTKWRVGEFRSSSNPSKTVLMLAVGSDIEAHEKHHSFIRWVDSPPSAPAVDAGANSLLQAALRGLANHVRACDAYEKLRGDMEFVDQAIAALSARASEAAVGEPIYQMLDLIEGGWSDGPRSLYDATDGAFRRIVYAAPPAATLSTETVDKPVDRLTSAFKSFLEIGSTERGSHINSAVKKADQCFRRSDTFKWSSAFADSLIRALLRASDSATASDKEGA